MRLTKISNSCNLLYFHLSLISSIKDKINNLCQLLNDIEQCLTLTCLQLSVCPIRKTKTINDYVPQNNATNRCRGQISLYRPPPPPRETHQTTIMALLLNHATSKSAIVIEINMKARNQTKPPKRSLLTKLNMGASISYSRIWI